MAKRPQPIVKQLIRAVRDAEKRGITRYRIAKDAGVEQSQISRLMSGESIPRLDTAEKIAKALDLRLTLAE